MRFVDGLLMALADSVPGVSGGTIAFLLGFYDTFIGALRHVFSADKSKRKASWIYLPVLGLGWCVGMVLSILFLNNLVETQIYAVSSVFLGFVFTSTLAVAWRERDGLKAHLRTSPLILAGFLLVFGITRLNLSSAIELNLAHISPANGIVLFVAAATAASAMILPGISGSSLLMAFGLYLPVISRISALLHGDFSALPTVLIFGLGAAAGLCCFVRLVNKALVRFRAQTMYVVLGMMAASLYAIAVGPSTLNSSLPMLSPSTWCPEFFAFGCLLIAAFVIFENLKITKRTGFQPEGKV